MEGASQPIDTYANWRDSLTKDLEENEENVDDPKLIDKLKEILFVSINLDARLEDIYNWGTLVCRKTSFDSRFVVYSSNEQLRLCICYPAIEDVRAAGVLTVVGKWTDDSDHILDNDLFYPPDESQTSTFGSSSG